jgi:CheY-like chemotaxis protein
MATDGQQAVDKYQANPLRYDGIVMDLLMPNCDGITSVSFSLFRFSFLIGFSPL